MSADLLACDPTVGFQKSSKIGHNFSGNGLHLKSSVQCITVKIKRKLETFPVLFITEPSNKRTHQNYGPVLGFLDM